MVLYMKSAFVACALLALGLVWPAASGAQYSAPDPGGSESANVTVPPPGGKLFGINDNFIDFAAHQSPEAYAFYAHTIGSNVIKTSIEWWRAERFESGQWIERRWEVWKDVYDAVRAKGMTPIWIVSSAPCWARTPTCEPGDAAESLRFPPAPAHDAEWGRFVAEVATRFPQSIIQVWNEPNLAFWWGNRTPEPERYAEILAAARTAVRQAGRQTPIIGPGTTNVLTSEGGHMAMPEFLRRAYAAPQRMGNNIDALAVNVFPHSFPGTNQFGANTLFAESFEQIRAERTRAGDTKPIYVTETAIAARFPGSPQFPHNEFTRADAMVRLYNRLMTMPDVGMALFHRIIEPRDSNLNPVEWGYAWLEYKPIPAGQDPQTQASGFPEPKWVYCTFAFLAKRLYLPCLDVFITGGPVGTTGQRRPSFSFVPRKFVLSGFECRIDSAGFAPCSSPYRARSLRNGTHTFEVRGVDSQGNRGRPTGYSFKVKQVNTKITKATIRGRRAAFRFKGSGGAAPRRFQCKIDSAPWKRCSSPARFRLLPGRHVFAVRTVDADGARDRSPARKSFRVRR